MKWAIEVTVNYPDSEEILTGEVNSLASFGTWINWVWDDRPEATSFLITLVPLRHENVT